MHQSKNTISYKFLQVVYCGIFDANNHYLILVYSIGNACNKVHEAAIDHTIDPAKSSQPTPVRSSA